MESYTFSSTETKVDGISQLRGSCTEKTCQDLSRSTKQDKFCLTAPIECDLIQTCAAPVRPQTRLRFVRRLCLAVLVSSQHLVGFFSSTTSPRFVCRWKAVLMERWQGRIRTEPNIDNCESNSYDPTSTSILHVVRWRWPLTFYKIKKYKLSGLLVHCASLGFLWVSVGYIGCCDGSHLSL